MTARTRGNTSARPTRRLRADAERNRLRILAAAAEVFARRGLEAGLDEIARHAGVGTGTVYRRFPDKTLLIEALFERRIEDLLEHAETAAAMPDAWEGLEYFVHTAVQAQIQDRGLTELIFGNVTERAIEAKRELQPIVAELLRRAQEQGHLRPDVGLTDLGTMQVMLYTCGTFTADTDPDHWRRMLRLFLDGLRTERQQPSPLEGSPMSVTDFESACHRLRRPPSPQHPRLSPSP